MRPLAFRRGSVYVAVLGGTMLVAVIGVAGVLAVGVERRGSELVSATGEARALAASGLDLAAHRMQNTTTWRAAAAAAPTTKIGLGSGLASFTFSDPIDGDLANSVEDPILVRATGETGSALQMLEVRLAPTLRGLTCLDFSLVSAGAITLKSGASVAAVREMASNASISASSATVDANVAAVGTISGTTYLGGGRTGITPIEFPAATVFADLAKLGTAIPFAALGGGSLNKTVLGPGVSPYSAGDPNGIYVIDCKGSNLTIDDARILGTLIVLNAGSISQIIHSVLMEPAAGDMPTLIVQGPMQFKTDGKDLRESVININLNPAGVPYRGVTDGDQSDAYASVLRGTIYVSGAVVISGKSMIHGTLAVGSLTVDGSGEATVRDDPNLGQPQGFRAWPGFTIEPETWRRPVN